MKFEDKYFVRLTFSKDQIKKNLKNALKDLFIAEKVNILEAKFNYAYTALIKGGITLLSYYQVKVKKCARSSHKNNREISSDIKK